MKTEGLEIVECDAEGYKRLIDGPLWTLAMISWAPRFDPANFNQVERHLKTDETFVLLSGSATLVMGRDIELVPMEPLKYYNVKAGVWHHIFVEKGSCVLVAENSDTSRENSEYEPAVLPSKPRI